MLEPDCVKSPTGHHQYLFYTSDHVGSVRCRFCQEPPVVEGMMDFLDRWERHS